MAIVSQGTFGIASRYILYHCMFSIYTLSLRVCYPTFYDAYNCVDGGPYIGWKALSSLLGILQAIVQFLSALTLFGLYIRYRDDDDDYDNDDNDDVGVSKGPKDDGRRPLPSKLTSKTMGLAVGLAGFIVLAVSFTFLIINQNEMFDPDQFTEEWLWVYVFGLGIWMPLLLLPNLFFTVLPFVHQIKTVLDLHSHGSLSLLSLSLQTVAFIVLAVLQAAREWESIAWPQGPGDLSTVARFAEWFYAFYCTINTHLAYLLTGIGTLVLLVVCLLERRRSAEGRITI